RTNHPVLFLFHLFLSTESRLLRLRCPLDKGADVGVAETPLPPHFNNARSAKHPPPQRIHAWMKARPLQFTLFLLHHLLPAPLGKQNPSTTLNPDKSLQISETPTWVLDYALPPWKNHSLPCKHTLWWSSSAILMMSRPWKTKLTPLPHKFPHLKNNYFSTKPPHRHNAPPPTPPPPTPPYSPHT